MKFIESKSNYWAEKLSNKVQNKFPTKEDQIEVYNYSIQWIIGALFKGILFISISYIFGVLIPSLVVMLTFSGLRVKAGGYHFRTYSKCSFISLLMFVGSALIAQHTHQYWSNIDIWVLITLCCLIGIYAILRYVPRDTENKRITNIQQIQKAKKWSLYYLIIWTSIMTISLLLNFNLFVISSCFGLLLELFSISKVGYEHVYATLDK